MRARSVMLLVTIVALSGCTSSGGGLAMYLMKVSEAPDGCALLPYDSEEADFLREELNWTGNPGRVDNDALDDDGAMLTDNLVELLECDEGGIASVVLQFQRPEDAHAFVDDEDPDCDDAGDTYVVNGPIVAFVDGDGDIPGMEESNDAWRLRVTRTTGAPDPCPSTGNQTA